MSYICSALMSIFSPGQFCGPCYFEAFNYGLELLFSDHSTKLEAHISQMTLSLTREYLMSPNS